MQETNKTPSIVESNVDNAVTLFKILASRATILTHFSDIAYNDIILLYWAPVFLGVEPQLNILQPGSYHFSVKDGTSFVFEKNTERKSLFVKMETPQYPLGRVYLIYEKEVLNGYTESEITNALLYWMRTLN